MPEDGNTMVANNFEARLIALGLTHSSGCARPAATSSQQ
jgi:hypothetical protein